MINRFEMLTTGIAQIQKKIQKIKRLKMNSFGLKGAHVMCIYYLHQNPEGLTAADLSRKCVEDKAAISRILSELEKNHFIYYEESSLGKKYRAKVKLTLEGEAYARRISKVILKITERSSQGISEEERKIFYRVLSIISENLDHVCQELESKP